MADRKTYFQAMAFIFTALLYGALHMSRTAWAYSKDSVLANNPYYKKEMLGIIDTCFLSFYAGGLYLSGWLGDRVKLRWTIGFGALLAMIGFCGFGYLEGVLQINSLVITCFLFIINGLGQSTVRSLYGEIIF
jgi:Sugar phosphate permease